MGEECVGVGVYMSLCVLSVYLICHACIVLQVPPRCSPMGPS